jgi:4-hydroxy-tetrahydrodipicolinate synthase
MLSGVLTALVTPMRDGAVDLAALRELVSWQLDCGVEGFVPTATTGEAATLDLEERAAVIRAVTDVVKGRVPVIAGAGTNSTRGTIELSRLALDAGADGVLLVCPYYNKPTQAGLEAHFRTVLAAIDAPVVIYNIPGRTGVDLQASTFASLAEHPRVVGIKEATGSVTRAAELVRRLDPRVAVLAGDDALFLPVLAVGGAGIVSASACVAPREMVAVMRHWRAGEVEAARKAYLGLLDLFEALFVETNPGPAKAALHLMGRLAPEIRLPLVWPAPSSVARVREALARLGVVEP